MSILFGEIHHSGLNVSDLDRSLNFYKNILGLEQLFEVQKLGKPVEEATKTRGAKTRFTMLKSRRGDAIVELIQYEFPKAKPSELKISDTGAPHWAFSVDNIDEAKKELESKGVKFNGTPIRVQDGPLNGRAFVYFSDPDGLTLQLFQEAFLSDQVRFPFLL
jgi:catechol 2,3-dioxygenase-like lactoylglutathione lyase family enzyme